MVRLVHCNESNADILSPLQECLFVHLVKYLEVPEKEHYIVIESPNPNHSQGFTGSVEYRQLLRVGRKSVLLLATDLTKERRYAQLNHSASIIVARSLDAKPPYPQGGCRRQRRE